MLCYAIYMLYCAVQCSAIHISETKCRARRKTARDTKNASGKALSVWLPPHVYLRRRVSMFLIPRCCLNGEEKKREEGGGKWFREACVRVCVDEACTDRWKCLGHHCSLPTYTYHQLCSMYSTVQYGTCATVRALGRNQDAGSGGDGLGVRRRGPPTVPILATEADSQASRGLVQVVDSRFLIYFPSCRTAAGERQQRRRQRRRHRIKRCVGGFHRTCTFPGPHIFSSTHLSIAHPPADLDNRAPPSPRMAGTPRHPET